MYPQAPIFAVGFSLGAYNLNKYVGEVDSGIYPEGTIDCSCPIIPLTNLLARPSSQGSFVVNVVVLCQRFLAHASAAVLMKDSKLQNASG